MDEEMLNLVRGLLLDCKTEVNAVLATEREKTEELRARVKEMEAEIVELETKVAKTQGIANRAMSKAESNRAVIVQTGRDAALG